MGQDGTDRTDATNEWDRTKRMVQDCWKVTGPTGQDRTTGKRQDHQNWMGPTGLNGTNKAVVATNEWDRTKRMVQDCRKVTNGAGQYYREK